MWNDEQMTDDSCMKGEAAQSIEMSVSLKYHKKWLTQNMRERYLISLEGPTVLVAQSTLLSFIAIDLLISSGYLTCRVYGYLETIVG